MFKKTNKRKQKKGRKNRKENRKLNTHTNTPDSTTNGAYKNLPVTYFQQNAMKMCQWQDQCNKILTPQKKKN